MLGPYSAGATSLGVGRSKQGVASKLARSTQRLITRVTSFRNRLIVHGPGQGWSATLPHRILMITTDMC